MKNYNFTEDELSSLTKEEIDILFLEFNNFQLLQKLEEELVSQNIQ